MTTVLDTLNKKLKTQFDNHIFDLNKEEYELCKKYYGNVMATSNGVAYIKFAIDTIEDLDYFDKLSVGDTYYAKDELFSREHEAIPRIMVYHVTDKEDHDILKNIVSSTHINKSISLSPLGYILLGVKYKPANVVYSSYANSKYAITNTDYIQPPKDIDKYIVLHGEVKIVVNKRSGKLDKSSILDSIVNDFTSVESLYTKSNTFVKMINRIDDDFLDAKLLREIKHRIFKNVVKTEIDFDKFLSNKHGFISFNDIKDIKYIDDFMQKGLSYDFSDRDNDKQNRLNFYFNDKPLSKFDNGWQVMDYIIKSKFFIVAGMDFLNKTPIVELSTDNILKSYYWYGLHRIIQYAYIIEELIKHHKNDVSISKIKKSNGYKNIKKYVEAFNSVIITINNDFAKLSNKKISFEDFYNEHSKIIANLMDFINRNDYCEYYSKYGNAKLYKTFANYMYHIYPPQGQIDSPEKRKALDDKSRDIRKIFTFIESVTKYEYVDLDLKV